MRRSATRGATAAADRQPVDDCADYLLDYAPYLQYDKALAEGLPIASGVVEGACRHLVNDRMNVTGARWSLQGAEAVFRLRALRSSDDFDDYWQFRNARSTNATTRRTTRITTCLPQHRPHDQDRATIAAR
jgi:hypothetical protein